MQFLYTQRAANGWPLVFFGYWEICWIPYTGLPAPAAHAKGTGRGEECCSAR